MDHNINRMLKEAFFPKLKKIVKKYRVDTQEGRAEMIFELKVILDTYKQYATKHARAR